MRREGLVASATPSSRVDDDLAVLDVAHVARADDVERAGLRGEDRAAVELAETSGRMPSGSRAPISFLLVSDDQRIGALELAQRLDEACRRSGVRRERATRCRITSVSVVDCMMAPSRDQLRAASVRPLVRLPLWPTAKPPPFEFGKQRLHVAQDGGAGGGIANVADRDGAGQALDHVAAGEVIADEAEPALGMEAAAVVGDDAGGFLAAMLEGVQAERRDGGGFGMADRCRTRRTPRAAGRHSGRSAGPHRHRPSITFCYRSVGACSRGRRGHSP